ncbi:hypothetical protein DSM112329_02556 [Paraconexibacter sp. AEG42_29]|uniref:AAA+ ATPase domain-containing protein n=1 Tax=Paraconexibacter sp. AEG42_29 TaxID=2997339 RepID=A0AAU7AVR7_9ACTN
MTDPLVDALRAAVEAAPQNAPVRVQLAEALLAQGEAEEALLHARAVLAASPADAPALGVAARAASANGQDDVAAGYAQLRDALAGGTGGGRAGGGRQRPGTGPRGPARISARGDEEDRDPADPESPDEDAPNDSGGLFVERASDVTLADVGGMTDVKRELERSFLGPLRHPDLTAHYGASLGGGLMLYGPPGCGKTLLARAVAGELGAQFVSIGLQDVLDLWLGESERKLHEAFGYARRHAPCVLFFDEVDALGQKRGQLKGGAGRNVVNQLLSEMDGMDSQDDGVFVLAATNHPWDVDSALRRPGRFDRSVLVLPPDAEARAAIFSLHLRDRPVDGVDVQRLAKRTDGFSGADVALVCRTATANVMEDAMASGTMRPVRQSDLDAAIAETRPSTAPWFKLAYNFAAFANDGGEYDGLLAYIRKHRLA